MEPDGWKDRLSRISTMWTLVREAHEDAADAMPEARGVLIDRYQGAIYRYLLGATRNPDVADELFQEFALRFVRGSFRNAEPCRGRFRDFLKRALINLVTDYRKGLCRRAHDLAGSAAEVSAPAAEPPDPEQMFFESWREELMARAWAALAQLQEQTRQPYFSTLLLRASHPNASSDEMAERLTAELRPQKPFTATAVRKALQRARQKFADLLLDEVQQSLERQGVGHAEELEQELIDIGLLSYCRPALERRRSAAQPGGGRDDRGG